MFRTRNQRSTNIRCLAIQIHSLYPQKIRSAQNLTPFHASNSKQTGYQNFAAKWVKTNNKIVSKPFNKTAYWKQQDDGTLKKDFKPQKENTRWMAVRKSMFKEPQGVVYLKEIRNVTVKEAIRVQIEKMKIELEHENEKRRLASYIYDKEARKIIKNLIERSGFSINESDVLMKELDKFLKKNPLKDSIGNHFEKVKIAEFIEHAAKRVSLDKSFDHKKIDKIPYTKVGKSVLGKILHEHLDSPQYKGDPSLAFSGEGLESLSKKTNRPVTKVTIAELKNSESKFNKQYVEIDAGSNAYFIIYENTITKAREYQSLATHKAIERLVQGKSLEDDLEDCKTIIISPNDLVYAPTKEELEKILQGVPESIAVDWSNKKNIFNRTYKMMSCSKKDCLFVQHNISKAIIPTDIKNKIKGEIDWHNKSSYTMEGDFNIKEVCVKLKVDRLGNIAI